MVQALRLLERDEDEFAQPATEERMRNGVIDQPGIEGWKGTREHDVQGGLGDYSGEGVFSSDPGNPSLRSTLVLCVRIGGVIAGVSSTEMDHGGEHVEVTDFAMRSGYRGLPGHLLSLMEMAMRRAGTKTAYTIARAPPPR